MKTAREIDRENRPNAYKKFLKIYRGEQVIIDSSLEANMIIGYINDIEIKSKYDQFCKATIVHTLFIESFDDAIRKLRGTYIPNLKDDNVFLKIHCEYSMGIRMYFFEPTLKSEMFD